MRTEKYTSDSNDDIQYAFIDNQLHNELATIDVIVAEVCGENDEYSWYWILQLKDGSFAWAEGSCDYTGWGCGSDAQFHGGFSTAREALADMKISAYEHRKSIRECLELQIEEKMPFALYMDNPKPKPEAVEAKPTPAEPKEAPMGFDEWKQHGVKYGYTDYLLKTAREEERERLRKEVEEFRWPPYDGRGEINPLGAGFGAAISGSIETHNKQIDELLKLLSESHKVDDL